jgi:hypothetical protein
MNPEKICVERKISEPHCSKMCKLRVISEPHQILVLAQKSYEAVKYVISRVQTVPCLAVLIAVCSTNFFHGSRAPVGLGVLMAEVSRSHSDRPHSVGLLGPSQLALPDNHNTHQEQTSHVPGGILTCSRSQRAAADPRFRPRGHRDRRNNCTY